MKWRHGLQPSLGPEQSPNRVGVDMESSSTNSVAGDNGDQSSANRSLYTSILASKPNNIEMSEFAMIQRAMIGWHLPTGLLWVLELLGVSQSNSTGLGIFSNERWEICHKVSDIDLLLHDCVAKKTVSSKSCPNEQNTIRRDNKALGIDISHSKCRNVPCTCTAQSDPAQSPEHRLWVTPQPKVLMSSKMHKPRHLTKKSQWNAAVQTRTDRLGTPEVTWWKTNWEEK